VQKEVNTTTYEETYDKVSFSSRLWRDEPLEALSLSKVEVGSLSLFASQPFLLHTVSITYFYD